MYPMLNIRVLLFIAFFTAASFAQVKTLTEAEYDSATNSAYDTTEKKIRRSTSTSQSFDGGKIVRSSTVTEEYLPPDKHRQVIVERGPESSRTEMIYIGNDVYEKYNSANWKKTRRSDARTVIVSADDAQGIRTMIFQYTVTDSLLDGEAVQVFSKLQKNLSGFENTLYKVNAGELLDVMWVNKDGLILKTEETVSDSDTKKVVDKTVEIYDYQPKGIKIAAPIK
jgi:hypothetical protein